MSEYGKLNGVAIDPGEGWEIVPLEETVVRGRDEVLDADGPDNRPQWRPWGAENITVRNILRNAVWASYILAFRRPKQTVQAGQGEGGAGRLDEAKENAQLVEYYVGKFKDFEDKLAAQSVALEKVGGAMDKVVKRWIWFVNNPSAPLAGMASMDAAVEDCQKTITLIQQASEVGK